MLALGHKLAQPGFTRWPHNYCGITLAYKRTFITPAVWPGAPAGHMEQRGESTVSWLAA
jgi:hypothetical protein